MHANTERLLRLGQPIAACAHCDAEKSAGAGG